MKMSRVILSLFLLAATIDCAMGQTIGVDICSCSPSTYEFTLDFNLFCPPVNITQGDAVASTGCLVTPLTDPAVSDLIPVAVQSIGIIELDRDNTVVVQENIEGNFGNGDTFSYTSWAANPDNIVDARDNVGAIQVNLFGVNRLDEAITNSYIVSFTNNCGAYPVLFEGQSAGWTRFSDLGPPRIEVCPFGSSGPIPTPTMAPSETLPSPTMRPSSPNPSPTIAPISTISPTQRPTNLPTTVPVAPITTLAPSEMSMSMELSMFMDVLDVQEVQTVEFGTGKTKRAKAKESRNENVPKLTVEVKKSSKRGKKDGNKGKKVNNKKGSKKGTKKRVKNMTEPISEDFNDNLVIDSEDFVGNDEMDSEDIVDPELMQSHTTASVHTGKNSKKQVRHRRH